MRKQNIFLTLILIFCFIVVGGIWLLVRPKLTPIHFPPIVNAELITNSTNKTMLLTSQEIMIIRNWIRNQGLSGWEPLHTQPPSIGDVEVRFNVGLDNQMYRYLPENRRPKSFSLILWLGDSHADWNNKVFLEKNEKNQDVVFFRDFSGEEFLPLRRLVEHYRDNKIQFLSN